METPEEIMQLMRECTAQQVLNELKRMQRDNTDTSIIALFFKRAKRRTHK